MKDLEIQEQAEKMYPEYPTEPKGETRYNKDINCFKKRKAFIAGAKWMQEQDGWIEIKSKDDLPKNENYGLYHVITKEVKYCDEPQNQGIEEYWVKDAQKDKWWLDNVIWYQPIIKPSQPKTK